MMTTAIRTGVRTRRRALALAAALAASARIRPACAESAPGSWAYAGNAARTRVYPGPGLDLGQDVAELWRIDGLQTGVQVNPCGVCDGLAYYFPIPGGVSNDLTPVVAVDAQTGTEIWRHDPPATTPQTFFRGELAIADGLV